MTRLIPQKIKKLVDKKKLCLAGLMSGTSADGVDVAILNFDGRCAEMIAFGMVPYPAHLRKRIFQLFDPETSRVDDICHMNFVLGEVFADALIGIAEKNKIRLDAIDLVGSHGQTIYHIPKLRRTGKIATRSTLQIGEPSIIAERTGIVTVADFRPRDIAAGGQGAPLVPYVDYLLFKDRRKFRAIQNIGGIANVTAVPPNAQPDEVIAFDTGPGNMIIDRVVNLITDGRKTYDAQGTLAGQGNVNTPLLRTLMKHPYLKRRPPKTTGREDFGLHFTDHLCQKALSDNISPIDILATVTDYTAHSIHDACRRFVPGKIDEFILCGGGSWNKTLVQRLQALFTQTDVRLISDFGIDPDAKEALSFAILAYQTLHSRPNNLPSATGAHKPAVLGKIVPSL